MDAAYVFGFGRRLRLPATHPAAVPRTLLNFILPTKGGYGLETVDRSSVPGPGDAPTRRRAVKHEGAFLPHGLLPGWDPGAKVYCPTVYHPGRFAVRPLEMEELLRVYQLPLAMDAALSRRNASRLPFADSPPPEMYAALLRLLWGSGVGGGTAESRGGIEGDVEGVTPPVDAPFRPRGEGSGGGGLENPSHLPAARERKNEYAVGTRGAVGRAAPARATSTSADTRPLRAATATRRDPGALSHTPSPLALGGNDTPSPRKSRGRGASGLAPRAASPVDGGAPPPQGGGAGARTT